MNDAGQQIQFALISHTNAGKTTLARTLIGSDIGEVRDAPHVTTMSESHTLLATDQGDALLLWDTPGFGDSVRLYKRLAQSGNPIGWFLREVVDRFRDRPFWLSQQVCEPRVTRLTWCCIWSTPPKSRKTPAIWCPR